MFVALSAGTCLRQAVTHLTWKVLGSNTGLDTIITKVIVISLGSSGKCQDAALTYSTPTSFQLTFQFIIQYHQRNRRYIRSGTKVP
jgi:hypothetical protein